MVGIELPRLSSAERVFDPAANDRSIEPSTPDALMLPYRTRRRERRTRNIRMHGRMSVSDGSQP